MLKPKIDSFLECDKSYDESKIIVFGAPFDSTTSYRPGSRFGSNAIRRESYGIETYSPYQDKDLCDYKICDIGDIELTIGKCELALSQIENVTAEILKDNKIPYMLGGEHSVTLGAFKAVFKKFDNINIIHFDAHTDLREDYLGNKFSHASIIKRCHELVGDNRIYQFGIRSGEKSEFEFAKEHTKLTKFNFDGLEEQIKSLKNKPIYLTVDLDVLDPSVFSGTGTPEAGGVDFLTLMNALIHICKNCNVVALDMVELAPSLDLSGASTAVACKLFREIVLALQK